MMIHLLLQYILKYRRRSILKNLTFIFPQMSAPEKQQVMNQFYRFFAQVLYAILKNSLFRQKKPLFNMINPALLAHYHQAQQPFIVALGHYGNWEAAIRGISHIQQPCIFAYKPLKNKRLDRWIKRHRSYHGAELMAPRQVLKHMLNHQHGSVGYFFLCDQYPTSDQTSKVIYFFSKALRFLSGVEKIAKKLHWPVLYANIHPHYDDSLSIEFIELDQDNITQGIAQILEQQIQQNPAYWLWSHKRFKDQISY